MPGAGRPYVGPAFNLESGKLFTPIWCESIFIGAVIAVHTKVRHKYKKIKIHSLIASLLPNDLLLSEIEVISGVLSAAGETPSAILNF